MIRYKVILLTSIQETQFSNEQLPLGEIIPTYNVTLTRSHDKQFEAGRKYINFLFIMAEYNQTCIIAL